MKWLLDEGIPKSLALRLRESGEDVLRVSDTEHRGQPDEVLWQLAGREGRIVVTCDRGFARPHLSPCPLGLLVVRVPENWRAAAITLFVWDALAHLSADSLVGTMTILELGRIRQRPLADLPHGTRPD